jgi:hypothetical protein
VHTAAVAKAALRQAGILEVPGFLSCSPDLNPIEGVWALLKKRVNGRSPRPTLKEDIKQALLEEWDAMTPDDYEQMILLMPERVQAVLANGGGHTRW